MEYYDLRRAIISGNATIKINGELIKALELIDVMPVQNLAVINTDAGVIVIDCEQCELVTPFITIVVPYNQEQYNETLLYITRHLRLNVLIKNRPRYASLYKVADSPHFVQAKEAIKTLVKQHNIAIINM